MKKALYRAFRPQTFDELVGQDLIVQALKNQIMTGRVAHAYLFSGSRGTGKTSCAKIFARAVNCLNPKDGSPCNECSSCRAILEERTMDVIEMDAASNRRIDDIRELRETVIYPPTQVKYKVYIIDEAHMITKEAFNALLKIMEEPPAHLIFILATTEPDKIPQTILSRLQRFEFKRLEPEIIGERLKKVSKEIGARVDEEAIRSLALAADGAMRDGLSLLDQALAYKNVDSAGEYGQESDDGAYSDKETLDSDQDLVDSQGQILSLADVEEMLGTVGINDLDKLTEFVLNDHLSDAFIFAQELIKEGRELSNIMREWIEYFRNLLLIKGGGGAIELDISDIRRKRMEDIIKDIDLERILDSLNILIETDSLIKKSDHAASIFLSCIARLINPLSDKELRSRLANLEKKMSLIESWQSPENFVREEVKKQLISFKPDQQSNVDRSNSTTESSERKLIDKADSPESSDRKKKLEKAETYETSDKGQGSVNKLEPDLTLKAENKKDRPENKAVIKKDNLRAKPVSEIKDLAKLFKDKEESFRQAVADNKIMAPAMLGHYEKVESSGDLIKFQYSRDSFVFALVKNKERELEEVLSNFLGRDLKLIISQDDRPLNEFEGQDPILEKIKKIVPADILKIED